MPALKAPRNGTMTMKKLSEQISLGVAVAFACASIVSCSTKAERPQRLESYEQTRRLTDAMIHGQSTPTERTQGVDPSEQTRRLTDGMIHGGTTAPGALHAKPESTPQQIVAERAAKGEPYAKLQLLLPKALAGDGIAQFQIAQMYEHDFPSPRHAITWYKAAATNHIRGAAIFAQNLEAPPALAHHMAETPSSGWMSGPSRGFTDPLAEATYNIDYARRWAYYRMPADQAEQVVTSATKIQGQRLHQQLLDSGKTATEALAIAGPLMFCDNPSALRQAMELARAAEPPPKRNVTPKAPETEEGRVIYGTGTGFFVTDDGYFVTCEHVVRGATSFHVRTSSSSLPARLITKNGSVDLALIKVDGSFKALPIISESPARLGDEVFTVGFPNPDVQGVAPKLTRGEISSLAGMRDNPRYFQISVPVQPGNSGGALVNQEGNVVGVVTARLDDVATYESSGALPQNVNYAVKGSFLKSFLNGVPELAGKLKSPQKVKDKEAAIRAVESAAVLVTAE